MSFGTAPMMNVRLIILHHSFADPPDPTRAALHCYHRLIEYDAPLQLVVIMSALLHNFAHRIASSILSAATPCASHATAFYAAAVTFGSKCGDGDQEGR